MALVGQTSRHGAFTQCLHTSDIMSQAAEVRFGSGLNCSMNLTCRQFTSDRLTVLSYLSPLSTGRAVRSPRPAGRLFHWWQATWQALQPMHTVVSVKKPT